MNFAELKKWVNENPLKIPDGVKISVSIDEDAIPSDLVQIYQSGESPSDELVSITSE